MMIPKSRYARIGFAVALVLLFRAAAASTPQDVATKLFPRTVLLTMKDPEGRPLSLGSGFVLKPGFIVSNFHVVEGAGSGLAKLVGEKATHRITGVVAKDEARDLVILAVEGVTIDGVTLSKRGALDVGETIFAVGNPRGLEGTFSQGIVSGVRELENLTLLQITAPISPGSSGGPIADDRAEVVGVAVATFRGGQNLNFAVPVKYVSELAERIGSPTPLTSDAKRTGTKSLFSGLDSGRSTDGVTAGLFLWRADLPEISSPVEGEFSISVKNNLDSTIYNPVVLLLFHNAGGEVVEYTLVSYDGPIPPGAAKRISGRVDPSVKTLTTPISSRDRYTYSPSLNTKLVIRTIGFSLEEN